MIKAIIYTFALLLLAGGSSGCTRPFLGINLFVVGERTALERQVLGTYEQLGRDLTAYASVRGVNPDGSLSPPPEVTESQAGALQAMNNRRYNRDDVEQLLLGQVVGEGRDGLLVRLMDPLVPTPELSVEFMRELIAEENADREVLLARLMETTPGATPEDEEAVAWVFAGLNHDNAPEGSLVQRRDGVWRMK